MLPEGTKIISVDDHVVEPPHVWQTYLPEKHKERGPRVIETQPGRQAWYYADTLSPVGFQGNAGTRSLPTKAHPDGHEISIEEMSGEELTVHHFDDIPFAAYQPDERVGAMDEDGVWAQLLFPQFPRFAGSRFLEGADRDLALACVRAYNDWMLDEWCAAQPARFIPQIISPIWDPRLVVEEIERCVEKGAKSVAFAENPAALGLPSFASGQWEPVFGAAEDTGIVLSMHIGSSGRLVGMPSADAVFSIGVALCGVNSMVACADLIFSGELARHPGVKIALSEGGAGWAPYVVERMDYTWQRSRFEGIIHDMPSPSEQFERHFSVCVISDFVAIKNRHDIGINKLMVESDFPHNDSNFPHSRKVFADMLADVPDDEARRIAELNARELYDFHL